MMKITAYADVIPIFTSVRMKEFEKVEFEPSVTLVPKEEESWKFGNAIHYKISEI